MTKSKLSARCRVVSRDLTHLDDVAMALATSIPIKVGDVSKNRGAA